jgi:protein O-GlcNAc transferase
VVEAIHVPELAALHAPIGEALRLQTQGSLEEALRALGDVVTSLERSQPLARSALACALALCGDLERECCRVEAASARFARALALEQDPARAAALRVRRALLLPPMMESAEAIDAARDRYAAGLLELERDPPRLPNPESHLRTLHFYLAYHGRDDRALLEQQARVLRLCSPDLSAPLPRSARKRGARLRIGFLSSHFRDHTISRLNAGLIAALPRERFECTLFVFRGEGDAVQRELVRCADRTVTLTRDLRSARAAVASQALDVLYYPDLGMDPFTYLLAFARLAPLQVASWGHPTTSGLATLDAFVLASDMEPVGGEAHYSEDLLRLPRLNLVCERPTPPRPLPRSHFGLRAGDTLYLCPQSPFKLHPEFDPVLAEILTRDPAGRLVLLHPGRDAWLRLLRARFERAGVDLARVHWLRSLPRPEFLALLALGDVMLDPFPFGGGHTTIEALAVGTPVITRPTLHGRGRIGFALYRQLGIDDAVARSTTDYIERALRLGQNPAERAALGRRIRERMQHAFGDATPARELGRALEQRLEVHS